MPQEARLVEAAGSRRKRRRRCRMRKRMERLAGRCLGARRRSAASWSPDASAPSGTSPDGKRSPHPDERQEEQQAGEGRTGCGLGGGEGGGRKEGERVGSRMRRPRRRMGGEMRRR